MNDTHLADRLIAATRAHGPLCVGIDPHRGRIPDLFGGDTVEGVRGWAMSVVEACEGRAAVIKPQVGLFEMHGAEGMAVFAEICREARARGLIVIADAKRGDIGSTAEGYARAYLSPGAPFEADVLTVNPYMGVETLEPYVALAEAHGKGVAVLARTSNPGAGDFQMQDMGGAPLYARVVEALAPMIERLEGSTGWSSLMLVAGATAPEEARLLRTLALHALFLVPGYGAQGAGAAEAMAGFLPGIEGLEGGVVNASRAMTFPPGDFASEDDWQGAVADRILAAQADLKAVTRD